MHILDTDTISRLLNYPNSNRVLAERVRAVPSDRLHIAVITFEEVLRGLLDVIHRQRKTRQVTEAYTEFIRLHHGLTQFKILPYTDAAEVFYQGLVADTKRICTQDCRIAAIAAVHGFTVITANTRDFSRIPGVRYENWTR